MAFAKDPFAPTWQSSTGLWLASRSRATTTRSRGSPAPSPGPEADGPRVSDPDASAVPRVANGTVAAEVPAGDAVVPEPSGFPSTLPPPTPAGATETVLFHDVEEEEEETHRREKREPEELDMTPMVDVTFLLLIFFMVTASFSLQKSIEMPRQTTDLPSTSPVEEETDELDPVELEIDEFGGFYVITADFEEETPGKQNLIRTLKRTVAAAQEGLQLKIRVHEMTKLQALVDGMDAGAIAGFAEIQVDQVEHL